MAKPTDRKSPRSVRVGDKAWELARKRAKKEGTTVSNAVSELVEGYAKGEYVLPQTVKVYDD